jgi:hypothetical protein
LLGGKISPIASSRDFSPAILSVNYSIKTNATARCWWLMSVILATWEAEMRRITV